MSRCELEIYDDPVQAVLRDTIERLYYSKQVTVSGATFPQTKIRSYLECLNAEALTRAYDIIRSNTTPVKNVTAYLMSVVFNSIVEQYSELLVCLPPEYLKGSDWIDSKQGPENGS